MRMLRHIALATLLVAAWIGLAPRASGAQDEELAVVVNPDNSVRSLSSAEVEAIFAARKRYWGGGRNVVAFNYAPKHSLRIAFDRAVLRMGPDEVSKFWINQRIRGRASPPRQVPSPKLMLRVVERLEGAIGYVPLDMARRGDVKIVAVVRGGEVESR